MSSFFGGVRDPGKSGLSEDNRRSRLHLARDINDEHALATDGEPRIQRSRTWWWMAIAVAVLALLAYLGPHGSSDVTIATSCTTPGIAAASGDVVAGNPVDVLVTGPDGTDYVLTVDGQPVQGTAGSLLSYTATAAGPAFRLQQCVSPTLQVVAPAGNGPHRVALLRLAADGTATQVAATTVTVTGTP
jgi:hypothetical protein